MHPHSGLGALLSLLLGLWSAASTTAVAVTTIFFDGSQTTNLVVSGTTSDTISSEGYLFTFTRDKLFSGGGSDPTGRYLRVFWPYGLEAQAVTKGPALSNARIDIKRQDGQPFAITSFTAQLLANTAGAGGAWEIMPLLNGEDGLPNPVMFNATGYAGQHFTYQPTQLTGFDAYKMTLYVDYAIMSLTVVDASLPPPRLELLQLDATTLQLSWPAEAAGYALEFATNLPAQVWSPVTNSVVDNGGILSVEVPIIGAQRCYRLRK